jgi:[glutamine synthetase] adenylyltransferase / [glutamine synthetase]-adenylyl-L-tyrosine phosphorylase
MAKERPPAKIARDVIEMRTLIDKEKPPSGPFDFKLLAGGLIDVEFIAQYLALITPAPHQAMTGTAETIAKLAPALLQPDDLNAVLSAFRLFSDLSQIIRLCIEGGFDPSEAPAGLADLLCQAADCPDLKILESDIKQRAKAVRKIFLALMKP